SAACRPVSISRTAPRCCRASPVISPRPWPRSQRSARPSSPTDRGVAVSLSGRVALVTGGGRGIGKAIALGLAEDGADVAVNYRRDAAAAEETVAEIEKLGRHAAAYAASVDDYEACETMVTAAIKEFGHVDILVNNAGVASRGLSVADT